MTRSWDRNGAPDLDIASIDYAKIQDPGHGNTPAAWAVVAVILIGFVVGTVGVTIESMPVLYAGGGLILIGALVALVFGFKKKSS